jgi:hypothetical protein
MHMHFFILRTYEMKELIRKFYDGIFCVIIRRKVSYREIACVPNGTFSSFLCPKQRIPREAIFRPIMIQIYPYLAIVKITKNRFVWSTLRPGIAVYMYE